MARLDEIPWLNGAPDPAGPDGEVTTLGPLDDKLDDIKAAAEAQLALFTAQVAGDQVLLVGESETGAAVGAMAAAGDYLSHIIITPHDTTPGIVQIWDGDPTGDGELKFHYRGGTVSAALYPMQFDFKATAKITTVGETGWWVITGADVEVSLHGRFTES